MIIGDIFNLVLSLLFINLLTLLDFISIVEMEYAGWIITS